MGGGTERGGMDPGAAESGGIDLGVGRGMLGTTGAGGTGIERGVIGPREIGRGTDGEDAGAGGGPLEGGSSAIVAPPRVRAS